jgi:hypothetical protein
MNKAKTTNTARAQQSARRSDDGNAFIPDPGEGPAHTSDDLAEILAEDFVKAATSGNDALEDDLNPEDADAEPPPPRR